MKHNRFLILMFAFILVISGCSKTTYTLDLPAENIAAISLEKSGDLRTIKKAENIDTIIRLLTGSGRTTTAESIQDSPVDTVYMKIDVRYADKTSTVYVYEKGGKQLIEQPYNGIYEISEDEFKAIDDFYIGLKQDVGQLYKDNIVSAVKKLNPVDEHGKSFNPADFTNRELLRYAFLQFNPKGNGFIDISFENLNRTYIKGSFGIETATPEDITCSCGQVIAKYNSSTGNFTWDKQFHYIDHKSDTFNEIKDIYRIEDTYYIELYKIFPDLMINSSTEQYRFYASYNDAKNLAEPLFTVTNADEFTQAVNTLDDSAKTVYKLTFVRNSGFKLADYEILS